MEVGLADIQATAAIVASTIITGTRMGVSMGTAVKTLTSVQRTTVLLVQLILQSTRPNAGRDQYVDTNATG